MWNLSKEELATLKRLDTPQKIQDFLDTLPINFEKGGDTCLSPRRVLREKKAHCIEGAFLAATALWIAGERPLLLDFKTVPEDEDHVVALYKKNGYWGALSKTNHAVLRFRDPIYRTVRELALSYFHEYFMVETGKKTLKSFSRPFSLTRFGTTWITSEKNLWHIAEALDRSPHFPIVPKKNRTHIRRASKVEREAFLTTEWTRKNKRT
ncbi:MAG: hypothetical protein AAB819_03625 [Patescibacteria group bacterium]